MTPARIIGRCLASDPWPPGPGRSAAGLLRRLLMYGEWFLATIESGHSLLVPDAEKSRTSAPCRNCRTARSLSPGPCIQTVWPRGLASLPPKPCHPPKQPPVTGLRRESVPLSSGGAGQAGLATSYWLSRAGVEHQLLERRETLGGAWQDRWDAFCLNTPNFSLALPGMPYDGPAPEAFMLRNDSSAISGTMRRAATLLSERVRMSRVSRPLPQGAHGQRPAQGRPWQA